MPFLVIFLLVGLTTVLSQLSSDPEQLLDWCLDGKHHKNKPGPEGELYKQARRGYFACVPWSDRSCCTFNTTHLTHHGSPYNFNFNHCSHVKNMSEECRRHFIQDSCFYECSPNVGPWVVKVEMKTRNERFVHVPLCSSDCEAWFEACIDDYTCTDNWVRNFKWAGGTNQCHPGSECRTFQETFETAENFCHKVWDESWEVTPDELACMRIWFDGSKGNPNDNVAKLRVAELVRMANSGVPISLHQSLVLMLLLVAVLRLYARLVPV
uniref:Folate receptor-like domain-containing protein n=1 Tax=Timema monikensis TaxID=170555 RepID=A0A7R9HRC4_9NEOP|nr:unnamed protein product [Timema monikensis]